MTLIDFITSLKEFFTKTKSSFSKKKHKINSTTKIVKPKLEKRKAIKTHKFTNGFYEYKKPRKFESERKKYNGYCEFCGEKGVNILYMFLCAYCNKWHCKKHRLPENHNCNGKPKSPPGNLTERWGPGNKLEVSGK